MVGHTQMPLWEILEELKKVEETELLDLLGITSDQLVEAFQDDIEEEKERYNHYLEER
tara:strand:- start:9 stop:182 length:174 start_codon:yes stop_codon:yes gene_type:complete